MTTYSTYNAQYDTHVILTDELPVSVSGCCYHDEDGANYILLNAKHSREKLRKTVLHELKHIIRGDMYNADYHEYD